MRMRPRRHRQSHLPGQARRLRLLRRRSGSGSGANLVPGPR